MPKFCCFVCPAKDYTERELEDQCPTCSRTYGFPLRQSPKTIGEFRIVRPLSRGFYAATYVAERGRLNTQFVLKVASKVVYSFFGKDFVRECEDHRKVAAGTEHVVQINDMFDAPVTFGDVTLDCHVAELGFINGDPLENLLKEPDRLSARTVAQIGIDLFRLLEELQEKVAFHNDLHGGNILIQKETNRADAVEPSIRAVAVDLGSISDASKSDRENQRFGDVHWIANHLLKLVDHLLANPDKSSDLDYRLASALEDIAHRLAPSSEKTRPHSMSDLREEIRSACHQVASPWREPFKLKKFNDSYNAQTLAPWYVPLLLVDPNERWLGKMSTPGPQIITGMRGCGKTLFLRALQLHARAAPRDGEGADQILERLVKDRFVGLYVSTSRLLDTLGERSKKVHEPYAKLYAAYALEAIRAVQHLHEISTKKVIPSYAKILAEATGDYLVGKNFDFKQSTSVHQLQQNLIRALVSLSRGESFFSLAANPAIAFPHLAEAIQKCSPLWNTAYVLFLLDDVSTRYLHEPRIAELLSALQFQSTSCAFKITSEAQTLELALRSPGQRELARAGRDYDVFDLGAEVYNRITKRPKANAEDRVHGKHFVEQILKQRAKYYFNHPAAAPSELLGDASLESIAKNIASAPKTSTRKKEAYCGITALTRVCVGDIGDVISLYELILHKAEGHQWPIPASIQSESYQEFCSRRLYDLNRRKGELKDVALSFAEASHELLAKSYRDTTGKRTTRDRLRQYMSIYIRITTGDVNWQYEKVRDLIDSGLFVFAGGSDAPRTKTKDSNPIQQFKLTYRKIYGLSNFIGLAESDRFELSGDQLEEWLRNPSNGKEILLRNLGGNGDDAEDSEDHDVKLATEATVESVPTAAKPKVAIQRHLFDTHERIKEIFPGLGTELDADTQEWLQQYVPRVEKLSLPDLANVKFRCVVLGLGFEPRALASARRLSKVIHSEHALLVKYLEQGKAKEISEAIAQVTSESTVIEYEQIRKPRLPMPIGNTLIDISGLAKPVIFHSVRQALRQNGVVWICHTRAKSYYPLDEDISKVIEAERSRDHYALLSSLTKVLTGEEGPYRIKRLHSSDADVSRRRVLFAFASAKHERLLTLLEHRDYDQLEIVAPKGKNPRGIVARIAADVAAKNFGSGKITELDSDDFDGILTLLMCKYQHWYVDRGFNFDLALTGSKLQGVAAAAVSAAVKMSDCLYVSPKTFDKDRFTKGVSTTSVFKISLPQI